MPSRRSDKQLRLLLAAVAAALLLLPAANATSGATSRVSLNSNGEQANGASMYPAVSGDGRAVAFRSGATNLVAADTNGVEDIFVRELPSGETTRISVDNTGVEANNASHAPAIDGTGLVVAFESDATNLETGDTNARRDVFVRDRQGATTSRVSVSGDGTQSNGDSGQPAVSADGRFIAFASDATNLVAEDTNGVQDIFVHDRQTGATTRVNVSSSGEEASRFSLRPAISPDGRFVAFESNASNLVPGDALGRSDIFLHDRQTGETTRVSLADDESEANEDSFQAAVDAGGRHVAFASAATNLAPNDTNLAFDVFVRDLEAGKTTRVSTGLSAEETNAASVVPTISADGRLVAFWSEEADLVADDTNFSFDAFVRDLATGATQRVSLSSLDQQAAAGSDYPVLSSNGLAVAFASASSTLVPGDTNIVHDVFVRVLPPPAALPPPSSPPASPPPVSPPLPPPPAAAAPPPPAVRCRTPRVVGLRFAVARTKIRRANCSLGRLRKARSRRVGRVLRQSPRAGLVVRRGAPVHLVVGRR